MTFTTMSSRHFNQHAGDAKKAADNGPVFITDRSRPAHVLLSIEEYRRLTGGDITLGEALAQRDVPDFDFVAPRAGTVYRPADLP